MMARIRSVHPGLFTDEAFVSLSADAQVLLIGLWTEADDQGIFEWKPVTIRMRLRPTKDGPVEPLLSEIEAANCIRRYEMNGRQLGAIRNFREYQRPKSPNSLHPTNDEIRKYTASKREISEIKAVEPPSIPPKGEIVPQMEGRGEKGKEEKKERGGAAAPADGKYVFAGRVARLTAEDFERWKKAYAAIPNFEAALQAADDYYADNPPPGGKWFFAVSNWLKRENEQALAKTAKGRNGPGGGPVRPPAIDVTSPEFAEQREAERKAALGIKP